MPRVRIKVDSNGQITPSGIIKKVYSDGAPLTAVLGKLLEGPNSIESNHGYLTLIPENTRLLSISIRDEIAYINFSEDFKFNQLGVEGYIAQIKQIVYTACDFPTVSKVMFLIDGKEHDFLGPEGVYIGRPISIEDLK